MKNIEKTRARTLVHRIYELFSDKKRLLAKDALSKLGGSVPTIIKARKLLGVKSTKIAGRWCWLYPKFTPDEALGRGSKVIYRCMNINCIDPVVGKPRFEVPKDQRKVRCPYCRGRNVVRTKSWNKVVDDFKKVMLAHKYDAPIETVLYTLNKYLKSKVYSAKNELEVYKYRNEHGKYHWVLVDEEVVDWLYEIIEAHKGKIRVAAVFELALKEKGWWSHALLEKARLKLGNIKEIPTQNPIYWIDRNKHSINTINTAPDDSWRPRVDPREAERISDEWMPRSVGKRLRRLNFLWELVQRAEGGEDKAEALKNFKYYKTQLARQYPDEIQYWSGDDIGISEEVKARPAAIPVKRIKKAAVVRDLEDITL
jgi:DNA-directed RNA polymerase subunit RPC12/RpoP